MTTQEWALTTWANKASATYVPINKSINNRFIDAYGRLQSDLNPIIENRPRRPYKMDDGSPSYVMYDDDANGSVPVIRITEA